MENNDLIYTRNVISSCNFYLTFQKLVNRPEMLKQMDGLKYDPSPIILFIGLKGKMEDYGLKSNNIWQLNGNEYEDSIDEYLNDPLNKEFPLLFVASGSAKDKSWDQRYPGRITMQIITFVKREFFEKWEN